MCHSNRAAFREQVNFLRRQFLQDGGLPFTDVLTQQGIEQALAASDTTWLDRIFSPLVTLWVFLGQVLSADQSCRSVVFLRLPTPAGRIQQTISILYHAVGSYIGPSRTTMRDQGSMCIQINGGR